MEWEFIESHNLSSVKIAKEDNTRIRYLSESEEAALLSALAFREAQLCEDHDSHQYADFFTPLITLAMHTRMRKGEMLTLRWESVG